MGVARRILVAVDGSTLTHSVIHTAIQEAMCRKAELHIVHVIEKEWVVPDSEEELAIREEEEEAASFLSSMKAEVEASGR